VAHAATTGESTVVVEFSHSLLSYLEIVSCTFFIQLPTSFSVLDTALLEWGSEHALRAYKYMPRYTWIIHSTGCGKKVDP